MKAPRRSSQHLIAAALAILTTLLAIGISEGHCEEVSIAKPALLYASLAAADLASTNYAISHGATEANPWMQEHRAAKSLAVAAAFTLADVQLQRSGHKRGAKLLRITYTVIRVAAIAVNVRNARQGR